MRGEHLRADLAHRRYFRVDACKALNQRDVAEGVGDVERESAGRERQVAVETLLAAEVDHHRKVQKRAEGKTLCSSGFHKWEVMSAHRFDVQPGKLVTAEQCKRCGEERIQST